MNAQSDDNPSAQGATISDQRSSASRLTGAKPAPEAGADPGKDPDDGVLEILESCVELASSAPPPVAPTAEGSGDAVPEASSAPAIPAAPRVPAMPATPQWPSVPAAGGPSQGPKTSDTSPTLSRTTTSSSDAPVVAVSQHEAEAEQAPSPKAEPRPDERPPRKVFRGILAAAGLAVVLAAVWSAFQIGTQRQRGGSAQDIAPVVPVPLESERAADIANSAAAETSPRPEPAADSRRDKATVEPAAAGQSVDPAELAGEPFARDEAFLALERAAERAGRCGRAKTGQTVRVRVTFAPTGRTDRIYLVPGPLSGTPTGWCITRIFRSAKVSPFTGEPVTLHKDVQVLPKRGAGSTGVAVPEEL